MPTACQEFVFQKGEGDREEKDRGQESLVH
jgi:hypothetical protein